MRHTDKTKKPPIDHNDPSGTDPNRYDMSKGEHKNDNDDYSRKPENHPSQEDRLLHPDNGER